MRYKLLLAVACLAGAAAHGGVGVGGAKPPGEEVVPGLAQQTANVALRQDGGALAAVLPIDPGRACEHLVGLRQQSWLGHHQHHLPADPPRRGGHGVEPRALGLSHHLLVRVVHQPDAVARVRDQRRERVGLHLRLHLRRRLRDGVGAGRVGAADALDVDGGAHGAHRPRRDHLGLQQLPQQVALHGHLHQVLGDRGRRRQRRQGEACTARDDHRHMLPRRRRHRVGSRRAPERRVRRRRPLPLGGRLRGRLRGDRHDGRAAALPRAARPALELAQHAVGGHHALGRGLRHRRRRRRECGLGRDGAEPRQDLVGLDGRVRRLHHGHGEQHCRAHGGQGRGQWSVDSITRVRETLRRSGARTARHGPGQARLKKGGAANRTRAEGGARGKAGRGTWATARGRGRHVGGAESRGRALGLGGFQWEEAARRLRGDGGRRGALHAGRLAASARPSRSPCRAASGASSPVARSAGWAAGTGWLAGARAIDGVVAWAPLGVSLASIAALPANQLRICSGKCNRFTLVPNQEILLIWNDRTRAYLHLYL
jgi:hypothetical protein